VAADTAARDDVGDPYGPACAYPLFLFIFVRQPRLSLSLSLAEDNRGKWFMVSHPLRPERGRQMVVVR